MHETVMNFIRSALLPEEIKGKRVLEVGSLNVNGSAADWIGRHGPAEYIGTDARKGPGVDRVVDGGKVHREFGHETFDIVVSTETLEHVKDWRPVISSMKKVVKRRGLLLLTTRSPGYPYHEHPGDYWRYTYQDIQVMFADMILKRLEIDTSPSGPGVFVKTQRPTAFLEKDLTHYKVHAMIPPVQGKK